MPRRNPPSDLSWYEEPGDPLDFELRDTLRQRAKNPVTTGEDSFSLQHAPSLIRCGGLRHRLDWLPFDRALLCGLVECLRMREMPKDCGQLPSRCRPHGGRVAVDQGHITLPDLPGICCVGKADLPREVKVPAHGRGSSPAPA